MFGHILGQNNAQSPLPPMTPQQQEGLAAALIQAGPLIHAVLQRIAPLVDQPIIRLPYTMPLVTSFTIGAGVTGARLPDTDFIHALEWPFEVHKVKFSNDPSHTFRDWRVNIHDQTFNQDWMKSSAMVALLTANNTGFWELGFPWVVRPKGGGTTFTVDNLDTVNATTVDVSLQGYLMIPRA